MTSIFVAKLDFGVTSEQLKSAFEEYGRVLKSSIAMDRETGKSRGFGFVEMENADEARNAISALDNSLLNSRSISVKEAEARENRAPREVGARPTFTPGERKPFQRSEPSRPSSAPEITPEDFIKLAASSGKSEGGKKEKKKKGGTMEAYKKSGKTPRYDLDDDFDDWRPSSTKRNIQFESDEDEDDNW
jgi:RNA recognition motif-containing protein